MQNILYQCDAGKEGMCCEFDDAHGFHHCWEQALEGGTLENHSEYQLKYYRQQDAELIDIDALVTLPCNANENDIIPWLVAFNLIEDTDNITVENEDSGYNIMNNGKLFGFLNEVVIKGGCV